MARNLFATQPAPTEQTEQQAPAAGARKPVNLLSADPHTQAAGGKGSLPEGTLDMARQKDLESRYSKTGSGLYGVADGITLGFGDEIAGGIEGLVRGVQDPMNFSTRFGEGYSDMTQKVRKSQEEASEANPWSYMGGQLVGAAPTAVVGGAGIRGASLAGKAALGARNAAIEGGLYGFGSGENTEDRLWRAGAGATTGAALGALPSGIAATYKYGVKPVATGVANVAGGIFNPAKRAEKVVAKALRADAESAAKTGAEMLERADMAPARARGQEPLVADMGNEVTGRLARAASNSSPEAAALLKNTAQDRFEGQTDRIVEHLDGIYGGLNSADVIDSLKAQADAVVKPLYQRAMNDPRGRTLYTAELDNMLQSPAVQRAIDKAEERSAELAVAQGVSPVKNPFSRDANGRLVLNNQATGATPSLAFWDVVKRNLDDEVNALYRAGNKDVAKDIKKIRDNMRDHLDTLVPTYQHARGAAAHFFKANDAFEAGQKFASQTKEGDISQATKFVNNLRADPNRAGELDLFERGFMSAYAGKLSGKGDSRDLSKVLLGSRTDRMKMNAAVAPQRLAEIESTAKVERIMDRLRRQATGNSNTAQQLIDLGIAGGTGVEQTYYGLNPTSPMAMIAAARFGQRTANRRLMGEVAKLLASGAPQDVAKVSKMAAKDPAIARFVENIGNKLGTATREVVAPVGAAVAADAAARPEIDIPGGGLPEQGYKFGGAVDALTSVAKKAMKAQKPKPQGEELIADWKWRPEQEVADELGLQDQPIPDHVQAFGQYMKEMSDKAGGKGLSKRDLIKAFGITRASIQRGAVKADKLREGGFDIPNAGDKVRPEGAMAEWYFTPMGQRYLDSAEKGVIDEEAIADFQAKFKPFGKADKDVPDFMRGAVTTFDDDYVKTLSDLVARGANGSSTPAEWRAATERLRGIGPAKKGFIASLLGRGDQPTPDARQLVLQTGRPSKEASKFMGRRGGKGGDAAVERLAERQRRLNMKGPAELDPYYQHLTHHTIWDKVAGEKTTHEDIIRAMRLAAQAGAIPTAALALYERNLSEGQGFSKGGIIKATFADMLKYAGVTDETQAKAIAESFGNGKYKEVPDWSVEYRDNSKDMLHDKRSISPEELQGKILTQMTGDTSNGAIDLLRLNGVDLKPVDLQAGNKFSRRKGKHNPDGSVWASGDTVVKGYDKRVKAGNKGFDYFPELYGSDSKAKGDVYGIFNPMKKTSVDFSSMPSEVYLQNFDPKSLSREVKDAIEARIANYEQGKGRGFVGLDDPNFKDQLLGRYTADGQSSPGNLRIAFLDSVDTQDFRKSGVPDVRPSRWAVMDPELLTVDRNNMGASVVRFDPDGTIISDPKYKHRSYPWHVKGDYVGGFDEAIPSEVLFPDWFSAYDKGKGLDKIDPKDTRKMALYKGGRSNAFWMKKDTMQKADQKWLDGVMQYLEEKKRGVTP